MADGILRYLSPVSFGTTKTAAAEETMNINASHKADADLFISENLVSNLLSILFFCKQTCQDNLKNKVTNSRFEIAKKLRPHSSMVEQLPFKQLTMVRFHVGAHK